MGSNSLARELKIVAFCNTVLIAEAINRCHTQVLLIG